MNSGLIPAMSQLSGMVAQSCNSATGDKDGETSWSRKKSSLTVVQICIGYNVNPDQGQSGAPFGSKSRG